MAGSNESCRSDASCTSDSDFVSEMFCESCNKDNNYSKAEGFCVNCVEYFCQTCLKFHERFLPHHVQQDKFTMPQDFCLEVCQGHPTELIKYFCEHCETFACSECKHIHHKNCKTLNHVPMLVQNLERSSEFKKFKSKLIKNEGKLVDISESLIQSKYVEVETYHDKAKNAVAEQKQKMMQKFVDLEKQIETNIDAIRLDDKSRLDNVLEETNTVKSKCECLRRSVEIMQTTDQRSKLFIEMKNAKESMISFERNIAEVREKSEIRNYVYAPDKNLQQTMDELERIGSLVKTEADTTAVERHKTEQNYDRHKPELFKRAPISQNIKSTCAAVTSFLNDWQTEYINIAIVGTTGSGKSTFINSMCEVNSDEYCAAATGVTETTSSVTPYALRRNRNVILYDFPGLGAMKFPKEKYLELIDFDKFDFFLLLFSGRWTETDAWLAFAIEEHGKTMYIIRTHFDCDLKNERKKQRKSDLSEEEETTFKTNVLRTCYAALNDLKSENKLFLVDGLDLNRFDYDNFEKMLIADASKFRESKAVAIVFSLPITTNTTKKEKKLQFERRLPKRALQAALLLHSDTSVARCLIEEKIIYIRQLLSPQKHFCDLKTEMAIVTTELLNLKKRLYHKDVQSGIDALFENCDQRTESFLPYFDIVQTYTVNSTWLKRTLDSVVNSAIK